jgi:hypothetical protein
VNDKNNVVASLQTHVVLDLLETKNMLQCDEYAASNNNTNENMLNVGAKCQ